MSGFYFVLGNIPTKFRSRLQDINLAIICKAKTITKHGYGAVLKPLLDDLKILETSGISMMFQNISYTFKGTLSMIVADNLAAHALGGFMCNFSTVDRFCRFCTFSKKKSDPKSRATTFSLRDKEGYVNTLKVIEQDYSFSSVYGLKTNSVLNELDYFHVTLSLIHI